MPEPLNLPALIRQYRPNLLFRKKNQVREELIREVLCGSIVGDIVGCPYEGKRLPEEVKQNYQTLDLFDASLSHSFSDDSILSLAVCKAARNCKKQHLSVAAAQEEYIRQLRNFARRYPDADYGAGFRAWAFDANAPEINESYGDGSAMRSGVLGAMFERVEDVIVHSALASYPTHAHPEGLKGGIVTAVLVWMALNGIAEKGMRKYILRRFSDQFQEKRFFNPVYPALTLTQLEEPHRYQTLACDCRTAVSLAWINFREANCLEGSLRNGLRYDSDTDTVMAISGGISAAFYGPGNKVQGMLLEEIAEKYLDEFLIGEIHNTES